jgi:hypothetical protein
MNAAKINAAIGFIVRIIAELIGVVRFNPARKRVWFKTTPMKEHMKRKKRSLRPTFSFGRNREVIQKSNAETAVLKATRAKGLMLSGITLLATEKLIP